jgi:hypothetical protein
MYLPETDTMSVLHTDVTARARHASSHTCFAQAPFCPLARSHRSTAAPPARPLALRHVQQQNTLMDYYTAMHVNDTVVRYYQYITPSPPPPPGGLPLGQIAPPPPPVGSVNITYYNTTEPANNTAQFMSVVAYWGNGASAVRSEPRYVRSTDANLTTGTGQVTQLILIARYSAGNLAYLQWADLGCSGCGGVNDARCLLVGATALACATPNATCYTYINSSTTTVDANNVSTTVSNAYSPCVTGVYIGFSGTDQYGKPLKSGGQIELLRKYSVSKLGTRALGYARSAATYARSQVPAVPTATSSSQLGR